jgi:SAM-dependent methyltransferase
MSDPVFGKAYADQYDLLYGDKDYQAECNLLENVFQRYGNEPVNKILDLGCGTGNHAIPLCQRGYQVVGVDRSTEMLSQAIAKVERLKTAGEAPAPEFHLGDICRTDLHQQFDAVIMMFAVLGYQLTNENVNLALQTARRHLKPGGLFVFDVWYGPAVLSIRPSDRVKIVPIPNGKVIRVASGKLDTYHHISDVNYHIWKLSEQRVLDESDETHQMRFFFPQELALFLSNNNLSLENIVEFGDLVKPPTEESWNVLVISRAY